LVRNQYSEACQLVARSPWRSTLAQWHSPNWRPPTTAFRSWSDCQGGRHKFVSISPDPDYVELAEAQMLAEDAQRAADEATRFRVAW
jgi:hypothetical protein